MRMETLFQRLKMNDLRDLLGAKMSTGMKQKVSVARAIVHDPPVLIFDEATAGLDVLVARALLEHRGRAARSRQVHPLLHPHHARGGKTLRPRGDHPPRADPRRRHAWRSLRERHHQRDLEELFFQLISRHDEAHNAGMNALLMN